MKFSNKLFLIIFISCFFISKCFPQRRAFESYYLHTTDYPPFDASPSWGEAIIEAQGITHDNENWYITSTGRTLGTKNGMRFFFPDCFMWKIPVGEKLDQNFNSNTKVKKISLLQFTELATGDSLKGYDHWGDVDHYRDKKTGIDYLVIPASSSGDLPSPAVIIFRAADLSLVGYGKLPGSPTIKQKDVGWCAIDSAGNIFSSNDTADIHTGSKAEGPTLFQYSMQWEKIKSVYMGDIGSLIQYEESYSLKDNSGFPMALYNMQGGEFSPSGELLYISNGSGRCYGQGAGFYPNDGIHVFDTKSWKEVMHSTNHDGGYLGYFDYHYDPGCGVFETGAHTAEGLTIWDLDNGLAPFVSGQLHVLVSYVNYFEVNNACIEHFSGKLNVDQSQKEPATLLEPNSGTKERPFFTFSDAFNFYPGWDGAQIVVKKGTYGDIGHYSTRVKISSSGGSAIIGNPNPTIRGIVLYEHPDYKGDYRYFNTDIPDLDLGTINFADVASSLRVYNIKEVILYDGNNYTGASFRVTEDNHDITPSGWNDRIGSLKIIR